MQGKSEIDINWDNWIKKYFSKEYLIEKEADTNRRDDNVVRLLHLIRDYQLRDPAMADVVMMGQLFDCCDQLGICKMNRFINK